MNRTFTNRARLGALMLSAAWSLAACGGSDGPVAAAPSPAPAPAPAPQNTPSSTQIASAQQAMDGAAGPAISGRPSPGNILDAQLALDAGTLSGTTDIAQAQATMDASSPLTPYQ